MAKAGPHFADEIDLIELIQVFQKHKTKYVLLGLLGLFLGLGFTYQKETRYETKFKAIIGFPAFDSKFIADSSGVQEIIQISALLPRHIPNLTYSNETFKVITKNENAPEIIKPLIENALQRELINLKESAVKFKGFQNKSIILDRNSSIDQNLLTWSNQDIAQLSIEEVIQTLNLLFGKTKRIYPNPILHGLLGLFAGLVLAFGWMMFGIARTTLNQASTNKNN